MENWNLIDGSLCLGPSRLHNIGNCGYSRVVEEYNPTHSDELDEKKKKKLNIEFDQDDCYKPNDYEKFTEAYKVSTEHFHDHMGYKLKTSKDNRYCAVYAENHLHCDFFEQIPASQGWPFTRGEHLFTLKRNSYRLENIGFIMEFLEHPETKETLFIFNPKHGELSLYNMKGDKMKKGPDNDIFFNKVSIINEEYFLLVGWIWQPMNYMAIYNIKEFITDPDYYPQGQSAFDDCLLPEVKNGKICLESFLFEIEFFRKNMNFIVFHFPKIIDKKVLIDDIEYDLEYFNAHIEECFSDAKQKIRQKQKSNYIVPTTN